MVDENQEVKHVVVHVKGRLDPNTSRNFGESLEKLMDKGLNQFVIDFENLEYISSAGLRILLVAAKKLKSRDGKIVFCSFNEFIKGIFEMSGFNRILPVFDNVNIALKNL